MIHSLICHFYPEASRHFLHPSQSLPALTLISSGLRQAGMSSLTLRLHLALLDLDRLEF